MKAFADAELVERSAGLPPLNPFIRPHTESIPTGKEETKDSDEDSRPILVFDSDGHQIFFKKDSKFNEQQVIVRGRLETNDCDFPGTEANLFAMMW